MIKCSNCGGSFELSTKTRRRVIYKCTKCGRELPVPKHHKQQKPETKE